MKRIFNILICLLFIFVLVFGINGTYRILKSVSAPSNARTTVVIDAGHGGKDCGTIGIDGTEEKKINSSSISDEFESYLKRQCLKTTFNGLEIETFSWYKKVLGLL